MNKLTGLNIIDDPTIYNYVYDNYNDMIRIAEWIESIGYSTYTKIYDMQILDYNFFYYDKYERSFVRSKNVSELDKRSIITASDLFSGKIEIIKNPDIDPYEEEDWGYRMIENKYNNMRKLNEELKRKLTAGKIKHHQEDEERERIEKRPVELFSEDEIKMLRSDDFEVSQDEKEAVCVEKFYTFTIKKVLDIDDQISYVLTAKNNKTQEEYERKIKLPVSKRAQHKETLDFLLDKCAYILHTMREKAVKSLDPYNEESWDDDESSRAIAIKHGLIPSEEQKMPQTSAEKIEKPTRSADFVKKKVKKDTNKVPCEVCDGTGRIDDLEICDSCDGSGVDEEGERCIYCAGSGEIEILYPCEECNGTGYIEKKSPKPQKIKKIEVKPEVKPSPRNNPYVNDYGWGSRDYGYGGDYDDYGIPYYPTKKTTTKPTTTKNVSNKNLPTTSFGGDSEDWKEQDTERKRGVQNLLNTLTPDIRRKVIQRFNEISGIGEEDILNYITPEALIKVATSVLEEENKKHGVKQSKSKKFGGGVK